MISRWGEVRTVAALRAEQSIYPEYACNVNGNALVASYARLLIRKHLKGGVVLRLGSVLVTYYKPYKAYRHEYIDTCTVLYRERSRHRE